MGAKVLPLCSRTVGTMGLSAQGMVEYGYGTTVVGDCSQVLPL